MGCFGYEDKLVQRLLDFAETPGNVATLIEATKRQAAAEKATARAAPPPSAPIAEDPTAAAMIATAETPATPAYDAMRRRVVAELKEAERAAAADRARAIAALIVAPITAPEPAPPPTTLERKRPGAPRLGA